MCVVTCQWQGILFRGKCHLGTISPHLGQFLTYRRHGSIRCVHTPTQSCKRTGRNTWWSRMCQSVNYNISFCSSTLTVVWIRWGYWGAFTGWAEITVVPLVGGDRLCQSRKTVSLPFKMTTQVISEGICVKELNRNFMHFWDDFKKIVGSLAEWVILRSFGHCGLFSWSKTEWKTFMNVSQKKIKWYMFTWLSDGNLKTVEWDKKSR